MSSVADTTGREIRFTSVPAEDYGSTPAAEGVPAEVVELMRYLFTTVLDGRNASLGDGGQQVLGRPPRDFADYGRDVAATGVWNVSRS